MRIARLGLIRYGHLTDVDLAFPADRRMHIVLGANEAGKSTALSAIGDALFRFPNRSPYAFAHANGDLRLRLELHASDGRIGRFIRRKGRRDDLTDEAEAPLPESAIAAFLGGASRERFQHLFGLDADALRSGGHDILEGRGEVGESILQAHTGLHGFRALVEKLGQECSRLAGTRHGRRELHVAVDRFKDARAALTDRTVEPAEYKARREELDSCEAARTANAAEAERLHAERIRLVRIRSTSPARRAAARARADRADLGDVPALPADAEAQRLAAITARERASHDLAGLRDRDEALASALAALIVDEALLAEAEAIDALAADQSRIAGAERDRAQQRVVADQHRRALAQAARRIDRAAEPAEMVARIPDALTRDAAERAIRDHIRLAERQTAIREDLDAARARHEAAQAALAALPEAPPADELRRAVDRAKSEGRIDAECEAAMKAEAIAATELATVLATLPLWTGTADALAAARMPLEATVSERAAALAQAEEARRVAADRLAASETTLAGLASDLRGLIEAGDLPTPQAIAASRERRDHAWRLLRRHRIDGGAAPSESDLAGLGPVTGLPDRFEALLREADLLVDRSSGEAKRVAKFEQLRATQIREQAARDAAAATLARAAAVHAAAQAGWEALWAAAGVPPQTPAAMREWLDRRRAVLAQRDRLADAAMRARSLKSRQLAARAALAQELGQDRAAEPPPLADLIAAAERICAMHEAAAAARLRALAAVETASAATDASARALVKIDADLAAWRIGWNRSTAALGLEPDAATTSATLALALWSEVEAAAQACRTADDRIEEMSLAIGRFTHDAAGLARGVAPDLADADMHDGIRTLASRLAATKTAAAERGKLVDERQALTQSITLLAARQADAQSTLSTLHALAGTQDDAALQDVIARAAGVAELTARIAAREAELAGLDDGKSLAELEAEAEGIDPDTLPGRIADTEARLQAISAENAAGADRLAELRLQLAAMQTGHDAAGAAQDMEDALAEIDDIAARYVRTRLAHTLLRAGIDQFRRQQQGPLLTRAGALFARLTEDRYATLGVDEAEGGKLSIVAERPDRTACPADRLSEGTRDQLYLALRLAAIESFAARSEPLPFIADDLLVNFDDRRAKAALRVLGEMGNSVQVILFTHHAHIAELADPALASLQYLPSTLSA